MRHLWVLAVLTVPVVGGRSPSAGLATWFHMSVLEVVAIGFVSGALVVTLAYLIVAGVLFLVGRYDRIKRLVHWLACTRVNRWLMKITDSPQDAKAGWWTLLQSPFYPNGTPAGAALARRRGVAWRFASLIVGIGAAASFLSFYLLASISLLLAAAAWVAPLLITLLRKLATRRTEHLDRVAPATRS